MGGQTSCIEHPSRMALVMLREEYMTLCDNNHCAAVLLAVFEFWHNVKLASAKQAQIDVEIAARNNVPPTQDTELWVYKTREMLQEDVFGLFGEKKIVEAVQQLLALGFIKTRTNPRYAWDRTTQYLFQPDVVQQALAQNYPYAFGENAEWSRQNSAHASGENAGSIRPKGAINPAETLAQSGRNAGAIPETTPKTTLETTTEVKQQQPAAFGAKTPVEVWEDDFGKAPPGVLSAIAEWTQVYSAAWVSDAIHEALLSGGKTPRYVEAILKRWKAEGKGKAGESDGNRYISGEFADWIEH